MAEELLENVIAPEFKQNLKLDPVQLGYGEVPEMGGTTSQVKDITTQSSEQPTTQPTETLEDPEKARKLYNRLKKDGRIKQDLLGSESQFVSAIEDFDNANNIFTNLQKSGYGYNDIGDRENFIKIFSKPKPKVEEKKEEVVLEPVVVEKAPADLITDFSKHQKEIQSIGAEVPTPFEDPAKKAIRESQIRMTGGGLDNDVLIRQNLIKLESDLNKGNTAKIVKLREDFKKKYKLSDEDYNKLYLDIPELNDESNRSRLKDTNPGYQSRNKELSDLFNTDRDAYNWYASDIKLKNLGFGKNYNEYSQYNNYTNDKIKRTDPTLTDEKIKELDSDLYKKAQYLNSMFNNGLDVINKTFSDLDKRYAANQLHQIKVESVVNRNINDYDDAKKYIEGKFRDQPIKEDKITYEYIKEPIPNAPTGTENIEGVGYTMKMVPKKPQSSFLELPSNNPDDMSLESVVSKMDPSNPFDVKAISLYKDSRDMMDAVKGSDGDIERAAIDYYSKKDPKLRGQIETLGMAGQDLPNIVKSDIVAKFLNNKELQKIANSGNIPGFNQNYRSTASSFYLKYPEASIRDIKQKIAQKIEDDGDNNWFFNTVTPSQADKIVDELVKKGSLSETQKNQYQKSVRPELSYFGQDLLGAVTGKQVIPTTGFTENLASSFLGGVKNMAFGASDLAAGAYSALPGSGDFGVRYDAKKLYQKLKDESEYIPLDAKGWLHKGSQASGGFTGTIVPLIFGGQVLKGLGMAENGAQALSTVLSFESENKANALKEFPGKEDENKRMFYTAANTALDAFMMELLPTKKIPGLAQVKKDAQAEIANMAQNLSTKNITNEQAKQQFSNLIFNKTIQTLKKSPEFLKEYAKSTNTVTAFGLGHKLIDNLFGNKVDVSAGGYIDDFAQNSLGTVVLAGLATMGAEGKGNKINGEMYANMANNPEYFMSKIRENANDPLAQEKINNLNKLVQLNKDLKDLKLTTSQKNKYLLNGLYGSTLIDKANSTSDPIIKQQYLNEASKIDKIKSDILSKVDKATDYENAPETTTAPTTEETTTTIKTEGTGKPIEGELYTKEEGGSVVYLSDQETAKTFGKEETPLTKYKYRLENPIVIENESDYDIINKIIEDYRSNNKDSNIDMTDYVYSKLKGMGYDGLVIKIGDPHTIVFDRKSLLTTEGKPQEVKTEEVKSEVVKDRMPTAEDGEFRLPGDPNKLTYKINESTGDLEVKDDKTGAWEKEKTGLRIRIWEKLPKAEESQLPEYDQTKPLEDKSKWIQENATLNRSGFESDNDFVDYFEAERDQLLQNIQEGKSKEEILKNFGIQVETSQWYDPSRPYGFITTPKTDTKLVEQKYNELLAKFGLYDKKDAAGLPSKIGIGEEPVQAKPIEGGSTQAVSGDRDIQKESEREKNEKLNNLFNLPLSEVTTDSSNRLSSNFLNDVLVRDSASPESYSQLDVPTRLNVFSRVLRLIEDDKIFNSIVPLIPVDVMNKLASKEFSSDMLLHDKSMFIRSLSVNNFPDIVSSVIDAIKRGSTLTGAEGFDATSGRGFEILNSAIRANDLVVPEIPSVFLHDVKDTETLDAKQKLVQEKLSELPKAQEKPQEVNREEEIRKRGLDRMFPAEIDETTQEGKKLAQQKAEQENKIKELDAELAQQKAELPKAKEKTKAEIRKDIEAIEAERYEAIKKYYKQDFTGKTKTIEELSAELQSINAEYDARVAKAKGITSETTTREEAGGAVKEEVKTKGEISFPEKLEVSEVKPYTQLEQNYYKPNQQLKFNQGTYEPVRIIAHPDVIKAISVGSKLADFNKQKLVSESDAKFARDVAKRLGYVYDNGEGAPIKLNRAVKEIAKQNRSNTHEVFVVFGKENKPTENEPIRKEVSGAVQPTPEVPQEQKTETGLQPSTGGVSQGKTEGTTPVLEEEITPMEVEGEQPPFIKEGGREIVTKSGMTEPERQRAIEIRNKEMKVTDRSKAEQAIISLINQFKNLQRGRLGREASYGLDLQNKIRNKIAEFNDKFKAKYFFDKNRIKLLNDNNRPVQSKSTEFRDAEIDDTSKTLRERDYNTQKVFDDLAAANIYPTGYTVDGIRMSDAQLDATIQDIVDGIPSRRANNYLDSLEQQIKKDDFDFSKSGEMPSHMVPQIKLNDLLGIGEETATQPMSESDLNKWLETESERTLENSDVYDNIENLITQYERANELGGEVPTTSRISEERPTEEAKPTAGQKEKTEITPKEKATEEGGGEAKPTKPTEPAKRGKQPGKFEQKANAIAEKIRAAELPDWMKVAEDDSNLPKPKTSGMSAEDLKNMLADAVVTMGKLMDKGVEFSQAIKVAVKDLVKAQGEENRANIEAGFEKYYKERVGEKEKEEGGVSGVKKSITKSVRESLGLPKVELPKMGSDVEELNAAKQRIDSGEVNPENMVDDIINNDRGYKDEKEVMDMQYYAHQLRAKESELSKMLADADNDVDKATVLGLKQQLSDKIDKQTEAAQKAGSKWGKIGFKMQPVIDDGFDIHREKNAIKEAYGGDIPKNVQEKIDKITKERDEAIARKNAIEKKLIEDKAKEEIKKKEKEVEKEKTKEKKTKDQYKNERTSILDRIKKKLNDLKANKLSYSTIVPLPVEKVRQLVAISPEIGELIKSHVEEGIDKLEDIVDSIHSTLTNVIDGITKKDVNDLISGKYNISKERSEIAKKVAEIRSQAKKMAEENKTNDEKINDEINRLNKKADNLEDKAKNMPIPEKSKEEFNRYNNTEWVKADRRVANAEREMRKLKREAFESQKNIYQKGLMWAGRAVRLSILSGYHVLAKLGAAATVGSAARRLPEQAIGSIYNIAFNGIAKKAPIEGSSMSLGSELKWYKEFFNPKKFAQNSWDIAKTGSTYLNNRMGKGEHEHVPILYLPTDLHQIIKDPVKRATFEQARDNAMKWAAKQGLDVNNDLVIQSIENAAFKRAEYEIFQESNSLTRKFSQWKSEMEAKGNVGATGKFLADFMIPVSSVPTNIARRLGIASPFGLLKGSYDVLQAYRKGIENLKPEEADMIMRQLKQGSMGTALWLIGWFGVGSFGGLYTKFNPNKRRDDKDLTSDEMMVNGTEIPKPLQHALPLEIIQLAATSRRLWDKYNQDSKVSTPEAVYKAGLGSIGAVAEQIPVIETPVHMIMATQDPYEGEMLKKDITRRFEPQILRETGIIEDEKKKEKTFTIYQEKGNKKREATQEEMDKATADADKRYSETLTKLSSNRRGIYGRKTGKALTTARENDKSVVLKWGYNKYGEVTIDEDDIVKSGDYSKISNDDKEKLHRRIKTQITREERDKIKY